MRFQVTLAFSLMLITSVAAQAPLPRDVRDDEYIRQQLLHAADEALRDKINHLFGVWMQDPTDQPRRALVGAHRAINAYKDIVRALEREDWKIVAPTEPSGTLFPPAIPGALPAAPTPQREHHRHRR